MATQDPHRPDPLLEPTRAERAPEAPAALASVLEPGLAEVLPGLRVVDRDLELGPDLTAGLVCTDEDGATVLVLCVPGSGDRPVLACLDALAFARRHAALLARHLEAGPQDPTGETRVVLVAESFAPPTLERLACLGEGLVVPLEVRTLRSASGAQTYLVRADSPGGAPSEGAVDPLERFAGALGEGQQELVRTLVDRMRRMDEEVRASATRRGVTWSFRQDELARLEAQDGVLQGAVPPSTDPLVVHDAEDADAFLEAAMGRYARSLGVLEEEELAEAPVPRPADLMVEPILTDEELEAFRE